MASCCSCAPKVEVSAPDVPAGAWLRLGLAALIAGQSMIFSMAVNLHPPDPASRTVIHSALAASAVLVFLLAGWPLLKDALGALFQRRVAAEQLFLVGIAAAFGISVHASLTGHGSVYYEVVAILLAIHTFGRLLTESRRRAALNAAESLGEEFDRCEKLEAGGKSRWVRVAGLCAGDRVLVRQGAAIPVDGIVRDGTAYVRETALTGEPFPVVKRPGDSVFAGSYAVDGLLTIESTGGARRLDALLEAVRMARSRPSRLQHEADRIVAWFLPSVLAIAAATVAFWTWHSGWVVGVFNGLAVVLVACPCSMGLATPVGLWSAIAALAKRGIVPRDPDLVEKLATVDTVVFDKTGTLGEEELERVDLVVADGIDREWLLDAAASLQASSSHPVAATFHRDGSAPVATQTVPGAGIEGEVGGTTWRIGNARILNASSEDGVAKLTAQLRERGSHLVYVTAGGSLVAVASLREKLRPSAREAMDTLQKAGLRCEVMTGDSFEAARAHGLPGLHAGLSPADKEELVAGLRRSGSRVLFVGDGVNDAPAMCLADASLAIGAGSALARDSATGELIGSDLSAIPDAIQRCRQAVQAIRQNLRIAAAYNAIGMILAACGIIHPVLAAILMLVSSMTVTTLALRQSAVSLPRWPRRSWSPKALAIACGVALQGPVIVYLGGFHAATAWAFLALFLAAGLGAGWMMKSTRSAHSEMTLGMLAAGGLAMLAGWWADAGFAAVVRDGVCLCGCPDSTLGRGLFLRWNWMDASMVVASLQGFTGIGGMPGNRWKSWLSGLLGMFAGMQAAVWIMGLAVPSNPQVHFMATYAAMLFGMTGGMLVACALLRIVLKD